MQVNVYKVAALKKKRKTELLQLFCTFFGKDDCPSSGFNESGLIPPKSKVQ